MKPYVVTNADGVIVQWGRAPEGSPALAYAPDGGATVEVSAPTLASVNSDHQGFRWNGSAIVARTVIEAEISAPTIVANGVAASVITGLPEEATVRLRGAVNAEPAVVGGAVTVTSTTPGEITIHVVANPTHKPWKGKVTAA